MFYGYEIMYKLCIFCKNINTQNPLRLVGLRLYVQMNNVRHFNSELNYTAT